MIRCIASAHPRYLQSCDFSIPPQISPVLFCLSLLVTHTPAPQIQPGKLLYAVSAWWGFSSAADRQRLQKVLRRGIRSGLCTPETPTLSDLAESIDDTVFERIMHNPYHVIHHLLPPRRELSYNIRQRHHDRQLDIISDQLRSRNFIYRMLFKDCY